jgi:hypothetical protein
MIATDLIVSSAVGRTNVDAFILRGVGLGPKSHADESAGICGRVGLGLARHVHFDGAIVKEDPRYENDATSGTRWIVLPCSIRLWRRR